MVTDAAAMAVVRAARPAFRGAHDGVAFAAHAAFLVAGYSLCAVGPAALTDPLPSGDEDVDIDGWNSMENCYAFLYNKEEKGKKKRVLVKCLVIGDLLAIDVLDLEAQDKAPYNVQINIKDFFSEENPKNYGDMYKNFAGLIENINSNVLSKLDGSADAVAAKKTDAESSSSMQSSENPGPRTAEPSGYPGPRTTDPSGRPGFDAQPLRMCGGKASPGVFLPQTPHHVGGACTGACPFHTVGDHSSAASSSLVCPYLALRGFLHPVHVPSSSGAESTSFHRHSTGLEGHAATDLSNSQAFQAAESRNHDSEHRYLSSLPASGIPDHSVTPFGLGPPRYDSSSQRSRSYAHHPPLIHRPTPRNGSSLVAPLGSVPAVVAQTRGHGHGARGHMYQQSMHSMQGSPFPPTTRRVRPRALTITSFIAASSSAEIGGPHGFSVPGAVNRSVPDAETISRPADRSYAWGREGFTPFPWIPAEGDTHWWGTFNPIQNHTHGSFTQRLGGERMPQSHPENVYQPVPSQRMPPFL